MAALDDADTECLEEPTAQERPEAVPADSLAEPEAAHPAALAAKGPAAPTGSGFSEWLMQAVIGMAVVLLGLAVWLYTHLAEPAKAQEKPRPIWLGMAAVAAQMSDGRMVNVKVNLNLDHEDAIEELDPHKPAFQALIQDVGAQTHREELQGREGMLRFAAAIRDELNAYLDGRDIGGRIKDVLFEELTLMP